MAILERAGGDAQIADLRTHLALALRAQGRATESERIAAGFGPDGRRTAVTPWR
jgi:hypothetical protein